LPDDALLAGLADSDHEVTLAFVRRFQSKVYGVAMAVLGDSGQAEDVVQQTFERVWRHAEMYDPLRGTVRTWVTRIAHNLAVDAARARRATPVDPADLTASLAMVYETTPEQYAVAHEGSRALRSALRELPPAQARAVVMAGIYGMTAREVAEFEAIPLGTAKTRIRTAMERLRTTLVPEGADRE
jgi:RNA polymerase sigma-70 factor (ECF subfamily)